ncbi:MAG: Holliday junction branch migration protein RuvA, partial [Actinobacteria bacterium]|nr:Holliday junction branch migration protein RuvA [Actinomycetota bacterium]
PPFVVVNVGGVGYEVAVSTAQLSRLVPGTEVELAIRTIVRADAITLFGFSDGLERALFDELLKVQGVGPNVALGVLSALGVQGFYEAVAAEDVVRLKGSPGVGDKTARRIIVDMGAAARRSGVPLTSLAARSEIREALMGLGFRASEFEGVLTRIPGELGVEDALKWALKELQR